jgi:hypothetical protein
VDDDEQWLEQLFEFEVCTECGWDADKHRVILDGLGNRRSVCCDPIPGTLTREAVLQELARRTAISTA